GAVIERRRLAARAVHPRRERIADTDTALLQAADVYMRGAVLLRVFHDEAHPGTGELARIAHLAARFGIERRLIEHHLAPLAGGERVDRGASLEQRHHAAGAPDPLVALELGARIERSAAAPIEVHELAGLLGTPPLLFHRRLEARQIDAEAAFACDVGRQVDREAVRIIELEHGIAVDHLRAAQVPYGALKQHHAVGEGLGEALF